MVRTVAVASLGLVAALLVVGAIVTDRNGWPFLLCAMAVALIIGALVEHNERGGEHGDA
jgi:hypothetical protein